MKIPLVFLILLPTIAADCRNAVSAGSIGVTVDGVLMELPVIQTGGTGSTQPDVDVGGNTTVLNHDARVYIAKDCDDEIKPDMFYQFKLMDKTIEYTVDLSHAGCGCNAAFYLVSMPAYNANQEPDPTKCNDYYCDANNVCGEFCPEIDLCEANTHNIALTPHLCDAPVGKHYTKCDGGGYSLKAYQINPKSYGPGADYTIDTTKPVTIAHKFTSSGGELSELVSTLSQGSASFSLVHDKASYLKGLTSAINNGMVATISYWGDSGSEMSWLDVPPCDIGTACNTATSISISDIKVY